MQLKVLSQAFFIFAAISAQAQNGTPYWSLSGNSNAAISSRLGTTNATPLYLTTNNSSRLFIASDGKIGIGTTTPKSLFNVEGATLLSIFTSTDALSPTSGSGVIGYTKFQPTAGGQRLGYFLTGSQGGGSDPGNGTGMVGYAANGWTSTSHPSYLTFETTKSGEKLRTEAMRIWANGHVGIGTTNVNFRLNVIDSLGSAIFASAPGAFTYAVYATAGNTGIYASGGSLGLRADGGENGIYALGLYNGVQGQGNVGVSGVSNSTTDGEGVYGSAAGLTGYGGYFSSAHSYGIYARSENTGSYAGYFAGNVYTSGNYTSSDKRLKKNIAAFSDATSIIKKLKPKTYEYLTDGKAAVMNLPSGVHYGLIAQDLEAVLPNLVKETPQVTNRSYDSSGRTISTNSTASNQISFKAVNYTELIPIIIKGIQEQDEKQEIQQAENEALKQRLQTLEATIQELKMMLTRNITAAASPASLEVPVPNPAKGSTTIRYNIPLGTASARLTVINMLGQVMKEEIISAGAGQVTLNVSNLASGTYPCTLWVNGRQTVSRQLVIAH